MVDHFCDVLLCEDIDSTSDAIDVDLVIHTLNDPDCHKKGEVSIKYHSLNLFCIPLSTLRKTAKLNSLSDGGQA